MEYFNSDETLGYFCRYSSYRILLGPDGKLFKHIHLLFFTEENIKRIFNSEHILIDYTLVFPKDYYRALIIMYYDPLLEKMIPGIFAPINNKKLIGYTHTFLLI